MAKLQTTNEPLASGIPPTWRQAYQKLAERINLIMGYSDESDKSIPENVYPVADGAGGLLAGKIFYHPDGFVLDIGDINLTTIKAQQIPNAYVDACVIAIGTANLQQLGRYNHVLAVGSNNSIINGVEKNKTGISIVGTGNNVSSTIEETPNGFIDDITDVICVGNNNNIFKNRCVVLGTPEYSIGGVPVPTATKETVLRGVVVNTQLKTAKNISATLTAAECLAGVITSTSASAVSLTLPSAANLIAILNSGTRGTTFDLIVDNSAGANSVTIVASASITAITSPFTVTNPLVVTTGQKVGCFRFYFTSDTTAIVARVW